jgi:tetraacyldisaccharide 4'-kinase
LQVPLPEGELTRANFFAFCGIGNPSAFFDDLLRWGAHVKGRRAFRDHHRYTPAETERLERDAMVSGADAMICTEKDVFNLRHALPKRLPVYACRIGLGLREPELFWRAVMEAVQRRQRRPRVAA